MKQLTSSLFFFILLCAGAKTTAQEAPARVPLVEVLKAIQAQFGYQFNYAAETLEHIQIESPPTGLPFDAAISYISQQTGLVFSVLDNRIVSIKKPEITLCGYLKDKNTQEPIANATLQAGNSTTITNENGYFELRPQTVDVVVSIRHMGYKRLDRSYRFFKETTCGDVFLVPDEVQLAEIIVSDFLVRGIDKFNDGSFKIDFDRFKILPGLIESDVLQSVQAFPGIQSINETVSDINIRGGSNDQNLILWDGIKMYQSGHFFGLISMYNPQITQKVGLRKNGTPVSYTDGVSGTIAMETDKNVNTRLQANVAFTFLDANAFADVPLGKKSSVQVAARKAISDLVQSPTYTSYFERISQDTEVAENEGDVVNTDLEFDFYDHSLRWLYTPSQKDMVQLNFINANNELVFNENATLNGTEESRRSSVAQNSTAGGLQYHRAWTDRFDTRLSYHETYYKLKASNANILDNQRFSQKNAVSESSAKLETKYGLFKSIDIVGGYHFVETKVTNLDEIDDPLFRRLEGEVLRTHAAFAQLAYSSKNRLTTFNAGLRYNYLEKFKKQLIEPRLSFNHRFLEFFNVEVLAESKHQNTSQIINLQNDFLGIEKRRWRLSNNNDIPVLTSKQFSIGLSYSKKGWLFNLVGYFKNVNGITTVSQGFQNQYQSVSAIGSYDAAGADLLIRKQFKKLNTWLSYSYLKSDYFFGTLQSTRFHNNFEVINSATFGATYTTPKIVLAAGANWHTGKPFTSPMPGAAIAGGEVNYGPVNQARLNDYLRVDISALYQINFKGAARANIGISVWNILDKENTINTFYRVGALGTAEQVDQNSLGITPNAVFRVNL